MFLNTINHFDLSLGKRTFIDINYKCVTDPITIYKICISKNVMQFSTERITFIVFQFHGMISVFHESLHGSLWDDVGEYRLRLAVHIHLQLMLLTHHILAITADAHCIVLGLLFNPLLVLFALFRSSVLEPYLDLSFGKAQRGRKLRFPSDSYVFVVEGEFFFQFDSLMVRVYHSILVFRSCLSCNKEINLLIQ